MGFCAGPRSPAARLTALCTGSAGATPPSRGRDPCQLPEFAYGTAGAWLRSGRERVTARMLAAIRNPHVDIVAHPTGRLIGEREGADLDMEAIFRAAAETGTALEINAHPSRLDLRDVHVRRAIELGVKLAINSDTHDVDGFAVLPFGVATARRGWATAADVINTWRVEKILTWTASRG